MTDFRDMELLTALERHKHFARAAEDCGISQPAFSARIRNLEATLGVAIVQRGNRFLGFTAEGERVLVWAHRILADLEGMHQELAEATGTLSGRLLLAAVPTALAYTAKLAGMMRAHYPEITITISSAPSSVIRSNLETMEIDAGVTYLDNKLSTHFRQRALYNERYVLLAPPNLAPRKSGTATWKEAADLPLCLLSPEMQNRRIIDGVFEEIGARPKPVIETNAFTAALIHVASGEVAMIAPEQLVAGLPHEGERVSLALTEPEVSRPIGLITVEREPELPMIKALEKVLDAQSA